MKGCKAEGQWISLHETSLKTFSFASFRGQYERSRNIKQGLEDVKKQLEKWQVQQDEFEASLRFFEKSPYKTLLHPSTIKYIHGAREAWVLTKNKFYNSRNLFKRILATPLGEKLVLYSYKELIEDVVLKESLKTGQFSKKDLLLFYRLQDALDDLELSGSIFENVLERISQEISQRTTFLIILITFVVFVISGFIVGIVVVMARRIRESEERFRKIIERSPMAMAIVSMDQVIEHINQKAVEVFGYLPEDIPTMDRWWAQAYPDEEYRKEVVAGWMKRVQKALAEGGEIKGGEYQVTCKDHTVKTIFISGVPVVRKIFVLFEDITSRKRLEEQSKEYSERLEELIQIRTIELTRANERLMLEVEGHRKTEMALEGSRAYLDKIINSIADPIFVKDRKHTWILLNDVFCEFMGKKKEELIGKSDYDFFPKAEADVFWAKDEEVFSSGKENVNEEFFTDGEGNTRTIITKKTLYTDNGNNKILVGIIRDVTELRKQAIELKSAYEQLVAFQTRMVQAEKMASLGQLAAGIAHEINNPTAYILCNLAVLREYEEKIGVFLKSLVALSSDVERYEQLAHKFNIPQILEDCPQLVDETLRGAERIKKIVQDLKIFAYPDVGGFEYGDLHRCIDGAIGIIANELKQKIEVRKDYGQIPLICFKEQQILQVFINLLSNSIQAIENRGAITIKTYVEGRNVFVEVTDTGRGISEEVLSKIFDPFFTTKPIGEGTGLGLSVVHGIVEQHQGIITVKSKLGAGTTFTLQLLQDGPIKKSA
ncbi:MAG: PAS domain S-box protein, partial [Candidatus Omnitrophica bacterium]|nr:PAS domain S-box protein [Candidatus Omnitrophota bacterium]